MTAENSGTDPDDAAPLVRASMRPRPMTAENAHRLDLGLDERGASMRPRPMTAENFRQSIQRRPAGCAGFNEAAADDRGKRRAT